MVGSGHWALMLGIQGNDDPPCVPFAAAAASGLQLPVLARVARVPCNRFCSCMHAAPYLHYRPRLYSDVFRSLWPVLGSCSFIHSNGQIILHVFIAFFFAWNIHSSKTVASHADWTTGRSWTRPAAQQLKWVGFYCYGLRVRARAPAMVSAMVRVTGSKPTSSIMLALSNDS
jgi:hypothetical protein